MGGRVLRAGKWALLVLGTALALSPLATGVRAWQAEGSVRRALNQIAAAGAPVKATQLVRPPVPDAENAAIIYRKAFRAMRLSERDKELLARIAWGGFDAADPAIAAQAKEILKRNAEALQLIHRASAMPRCDFRLDWSKAWDVRVPHLAQLRSCSQLLALESMMLARASRADEAFDSCAANFRLASAADEPILIGQLVRYAIIGMASRALGAVLCQSQPSAAACRSLSAETARTDLTRALVKTMEGERAMGLSFFDLLRSDPAGAIETLTGACAEPLRLPNPPAPTFSGNLWIASEELTYLETMDRVITQAALPYREAVKIRPSVDQILRDIPWRRQGIVTVLAVVAPTRAQKLRDRGVANLGLAQVSLLLKAYRATHGVYPASLTELRGFAGCPMPSDPFSGRRFVYRREGAGFVVYSWGPNLKDDGGVPPPAKKPDEGDVVLRCLR
jgi:hypothetical protein